MPAIACIPPWAMKEILEQFGYEVIAEDEYNWAMMDRKETSGGAKEEREPLILPKRGELLALDIQMDTLIKAKLDLHTYFSIKARVLGTLDLTAEGTDFTKKIQ